MTRDALGRFAPRPTFPCCDTCGSTLAENLHGNLRCAIPWCGQYGQVAGNTGADVGTLAEAAA